MNDNFLKTAHIKPGMFHFFRMEILGTLIMVAFTFLGFILPEILSDDFHFSIIVFPIIFCFLCSYGILFAFLRARFLRNGGYCIITPDVIQSVCNGKTKTYEYKGRSLGKRKRKNGSMDIYIGRSLVDLIKFGIGRKYFKTIIVGLGLGAPLYNVVNADEVLAYLKQHNKK